uniref:Uncharacterized protein n=1 Tax=Anguilla anguilla TaxID=7936 RepID=A0A0E9V9D0_ANGAN
MLVLFKMLLQLYLVTKGLNNVNVSIGIGNLNC